MEINKKFRNFIFCLQIAAVILFFVPPMFMGGSVALPWLVLGVLNTAAFAAVFYRDKNQRKGISTLITAFNILWCGVVGLIAVLFLGLSVLSFGGSLPPWIVLYAACAFFAAVFAYAQPRKFSKGQENHDGVNAHNAEERGGVEEHGNVPPDAVHEGDEPLVGDGL